MKFSPRPWLLALASTLALQAQAASMDEASARRFLAHASFGPTTASVAELQTLGPQAWLQAQFAKNGSDYAGFSYLDPSPSVGCPTGSASTCNRDNYTLFPLQALFFRNALANDDQLRQRVALALSEILVASGQQIRQPYAMANFQHIFLANAFGNYRDILKAVTLSPAMGNYLNMANNDKPNPARGIAPNENYGREVMQLFSLGVWMLNPDGSQQLDAHGQPIPTYTQDQIEGFAHAFTGWTYAPRPGATASKWTNPVYFGAPMIAFAAHHDTATKLLLSGVTLPGNQTPEADLDAAIGNIFQHPNVGPFIGRQLIQMLVTSNPSPAYVARVAAAFNGAAGTPRGDMKATISAVLLDPEASQPAAPSQFGKLREPVLLLSHLMRALGGSSDGVWLRAQAAALGESVFSPPTVFSFFPPDYPLPDDPALEGPAFGVFSAASAMATSASLATLLSGTPIKPDTSVAGSTGTSIDLTPWLSTASDPTQLVAQVNRILFAGAMSATLQQTLIKAVQLQPASNPSGRVRCALFLAALSPEYLVEH